jgi:purine-cytosine permease-like protein
MEKEAIQERIRFSTEIVKVLWTIVIVLTGGLASLLINFNNPFKIGLFFVGLFLEPLVILLIKDFNTQIYCLLTKLEETK